MKPVLTKKQFVKLYEAGAFGNHSPTWSICAEFVQYRHVDPEQLCHLRSRIAGGITYYNVKWYDIPSLWHKQAVMADWYCSAMAPSEKTTFQGEVMRGLWGLELTFTTVPLPMREALRKETKTAKGIIADTLLHHFLDANDYDWLMHLLDTYNHPPHVVEFSTYSECWGTLPGHRTVVWEVRDY
jgi:hypothetical protein